MKFFEKFFPLPIVIAQIMLHAIKFSFIVGSQYAFFSGINCLLPIVGLVTGYAGFAFSVFIHLLYSLFFSKNILFTSLLGILTMMRLPTIIAGFYAMNQSRIIQTIVPMICIVLFLWHSEGIAAPLYTMYWFIPLFTLLLPTNNSLVLRLINTTLIQHAVGSVIFLYRTNMAASYWNALIPVVAVERLLFVCGMFIIVCIAVQLKSVKFALSQQKQVVAIE